MNELFRDSDFTKNNNNILKEFKLLTNLKSIVCFFIKKGPVLSVPMKKQQFYWHSLHINQIIL